MAQPKKIKEKMKPLLPYHEEAMKHLKKTDPVLYATARAYKGTLAHRITPHRRNDQLFATLAGSVVSQQLSTKAAASIWKRVQEACGGRVTAKTIDATADEDLRAAGLSASKVKTLKALADAVLSDGLDLLTLKKLPHDEAAGRLTRIWGIGPWTAEMFFIFALQAPDVFSPGDLGLVRAVERLYGLPKDAPRADILAIAERWTPHRSFASLVLWEYYDT
jgi:DNA-3-methyladenine glycosylase II